MHTFDGKEVTRIRVPRDDKSWQGHQASFLLPHTDPVYPEKAKALGIEGTVLLGVLVDRQGEIVESSAQSGDPLLAEPALQTVRTWKYRPTKLNGVPVEVVTTIQVTFTLPDRVVIC